MMFAASPAAAQNSQDFVIDKFEADYYLSRAKDKSSTLRVEEKIVALFPGTNQNHGILRALPLEYQNHTLSLKVEAVKKDDGSPWPYTTYKEAGNLVLKIGDAQQFVHGRQTYLISYVARNVINFRPNHQELYWDVNGDQWPQPFNVVEARLHIPSDLKGQLQDRRACYLGRLGSSDQTGCQIKQIESADGTLTDVSNTRSLGAYETLTFAIGFKAGTFELGPEIAREKQIKELKNILSGIAFLTPPAVAFGVMWNRWRKFGDDPKGRGIIIPEYQPPKHLDALSADFLLNGELRPQAISAALIELATNKHLTIYEIPKRGLFGKKDYELELNSLPANLRLETKELLTAIFGDLASKTRVKISDFKKGSAKNNIYKVITQTKKDMAENLYNQGYYIKNPTKVRSSYMAWSALPFGLGWLLIFIPRGDFYPLSWLAAGLMAAALVMFIFAFIMPARSQKGVEVNDYLLGLKDYIKLAEADRLQYLQSPEGAEKIADKTAFNPKTASAKIKLFESLLPYAMLFGLEKGWAKQFESLYSQPPDWYHGSAASWYSGVWAGSLSDFSHSANASFSAPTSSSGSGFSGGSSGGGGGGGGGGW